MNRKMNFGIKLLVIIGSLSILFLIVNPILKSQMYGHDMSWTKAKDLLWIFNDSNKVFIDERTICFSREGDVYNQFRYKGNMFQNDEGLTIVVWEFNTKGRKSNSRFILSHKGNLTRTHFKEYELLNRRNSNKVYINYGMDFENGFDVKLNKFDSIVKFYKNEKYDGVIGYFSRVVLSDKNGVEQVILTNDKDHNLTNLIVYSKGDKTYLISITSNEYFDENVSQIFNF